MPELQVIGNEYFHQLHRAITNVQYYNALAGRYDSYALKQLIASVVLLVAGLLIASYPWARKAIQKVKDPSPESIEDAKLDSEVRALVIGFGVAALGFIVSLIPYATWSAKYSALSDEWTDTRTRIVSAEKQLYSLNKSGPVPSYLKDDLDEITRHGDVLVARDKDDPDKTLANESWERANEIVYGKDIRTKEQAEKKFAELQSQHRIPVWPFPPLPPADKAANKPNG